MGIQDRDYYWEDRDLAGHQRAQAAYRPQHCHWAIRASLLAIAMCGIALCAQALRAKPKVVDTPSAAAVPVCDAKTPIGDECMHPQAGLVKKARRPTTAEMRKVEPLGTIEWSDRPDSRRTIHP